MKIRVASETGGATGHGGSGAAGSEGELVNERRLCVIERFLTAMSTVFPALSGNQGSYSSQHILRTCAK